MGDVVAGVRLTCEFDLFLRANNEPHSSIQLLFNRTFLRPPIPMSKDEKLRNLLYMVIYIIIPEYDLDRANE